MKLSTIFKKNCDNNGYTGKYHYNELTDEFQFVISKGDNNAGAFLAPIEYNQMNEEHLKKLLELLDKGFKQKVTL